MRGVIITALLTLIFLFWLAGGLYGFLKTKNKSPEAKRTVAYILGYPLLAVYVASDGLPPAAIVFPVGLGGVFWLLAGMHLQKVLEGEYPPTPGTFIGLSIKYCLGGVLGAFLLGALLQYAGLF
ncbi:hypothetical protein [Nitrosococcus oceani]|uniref:Uncharacterized protein n=2 Tax=Nitrosococcus oceani TaxID=1229 RepID=Q3JDQ2_NITOC|nr:hypothetical protein [Nitrosococcus oceani]KFI20514.1 hypothetical protein IB75_02740 [Nitrosococcus oceani C-27]ABA57044.1 hypothetical protein Noc_0522 [Nitrosococcus oceani ATCC 19707]EDZ65422.1 hypothetical protein NOC27_2102 [Nitrosococcus oceani AFC27]KFI23620.1 hypothetical protein HW44_02830 [Nitrosococcus oceani]GEM19943.1 hypothetical protein NONS58_13440 [Nitrosococcus oceani]